MGKSAERVLSHLGLHTHRRAGLNVALEPLHGILERKGLPHSFAIPVSRPENLAWLEAREQKMSALFGFPLAHPYSPITDH